MLRMNLRITIALAVGLILAPISRINFAGSSAVAFAQDSAATPAAQASPVTPPGMAPKIDLPLGPSVLWVKGHPLDMPYPECGNLIERAIWGQQVTITDAPCKAKLEESLRIERTEPDIESAPPGINGSRPEDLSPPIPQNYYPQRAEPTE